MEIRKALVLLNALQKPLNLGALGLLRHEKLFVCELVRLSGVPQPTLSNAFRELKAVGLVRCEARGRWRLYSLGEVPKWVLDLLEELDLSRDVERLEPTSGVDGRRAESSLGKTLTRMHRVFTREGGRQNA